MVWSSSDSPLYRAVEQHNRSASQESRPQDMDTPPQTERRSSPPTGTLPPRAEHRSECSDGAPCSHTESCACRRPSPQPEGILGALTQDPDLLLIGVLIFLLIKEKADKQLIAALAFILLT